MIYPLVRELAATGAPVRVPVAVTCRVLKIAKNRRIDCRVARLCWNRSREVDRMAKEAAFVAELDPDLRAEFLAALEATHRPASEVIDELVREFVNRQRDVRDYDEFVERKVAAARESVSAGRLVSHEDIQGDIARRRASANFHG